MSNTVFGLASPMTLINCEIDSVKSLTVFINGDDYDLSIFANPTDAPYGEGYAAHYVIESEEDVEAAFDEMKTATYFTFETGAIEYECVIVEEDGDILIGDNGVMVACDEDAIDYSIAQLESVVELIDETKDLYVSRDECMPEWKFEIVNKGEASRFNGELLEFSDSLIDDLISHLEMNALEDCEQLEVYQGAGVVTTAYFIQDF